MNARGDFRQILKTHLHTARIVVRMLRGRNGVQGIYIYGGRYLIERT